MNKIVIVIAGGGALGSHLAHHLARAGREIHIIDDDVVELNNITVAQFGNKDLGKSKAQVVADMVTDRGGIGVAHHTTLENKEQLQSLSPDVVIDCFDNVQARAQTVGLDVPTLHVGVGIGGNGMVFWDGDYTLPPMAKRGENPVCTNALGAPIIRRTALRASEIVEQWFYTDEQSSDIVSEKGSF